MKRVGYVFEKIVDLDNIMHAIEHAAIGKTHRNSVREVFKNPEYYAKEIQSMLINGTYEVSDYTIMEINDGIKAKKRTIFKPKFYPDQIIHWAIILPLQEILLSESYVFTCGSIPGRGIHYGKKYVEKWIRKDKKHTKYCLKMDIRKFYPNINHDILIEKLERKIKDKRAIELIALILQKTEGLPI